MKAAHVLVLADAPVVTELSRGPDASGFILSHGPGTVLLSRRSSQRVEVGKTPALGTATRQAETLTQAQQPRILSLTLRSALSASKVAEQHADRKTETNIVRFAARSNK